jgi:lambda repressor-like predicted transcriptional regulator
MVTRRTPAEWADIVAAFKKSGQTQASFCREHGINEKTLGAHVRGRESVKPMIKRSAEEWRTLITEQRSSGIYRNA